MFMPMTRGWCNVNTTGANLTTNIYYVINQKQILTTNLSLFMDHK